MPGIESKAKEIMALLADTSVEDLEIRHGHMKHFQLRLGQIAELLKSWGIE